VDWCHERVEREGYQAQDGIKLSHWFGAKANFNYNGSNSKLLSFLFLNSLYLSLM
jgi:hypothetical protein